MTVAQRPSETIANAIDSEQFIDRYTPNPDTGPSYRLDRPSTELTSATTDLKSEAFIFSSRPTDIEKPNKAQRREPTQAFLAAKRLPHIRKIRDYLSGVTQSWRQDDIMVAANLCREQLSISWQYVDLRDDHIGQYLDMIGRALDAAIARPTTAKIDAIIVVVNSMLDKRLDYESRRSARLLLSRMALLESPDPEDGEDDDLDLSEIVEHEEI